jgi:hypothetical protein
MLCLLISTWVSGLVAGFVAGADVVPDVPVVSEGGTVTVPVSWFGVFAGGVVAGGTAAGGAAGG